MVTGEVYSPARGMGRGGVQVRIEIPPELCVYREEEVREGRVASGEWQLSSGGWRWALRRFGRCCGIAVFRYCGLAGGTGAPPSFWFVDASDSRFIVKGEVVKDPAEGKSKIGREGDLERGRLARLRAGASRPALRISPGPAESVRLLRGGGSTAPAICDPHRPSRRGNDRSGVRATPLGLMWL